MSNECSTIVWKRDFGNSNRKVIAARLADHADDEGRGIWPSVERIAAQCNVSDRTVQRVLSSFVDEGILRVVDEGGKGPRSTRRYDFNMPVVEALPVAKWGPETMQNKGDTVSPLEKTEGDTPAPKGDSGDEKGCHRVTQTTIEPPIEPSPERERGREDREEDPKRIEARGWALLKDWPGFAGMPKEPAMKVWMSLSADDRDKAERRFPGWLALLKAQKKSHTPAPSTYFGQKLFEEVEDPRDPAKPLFALAKPFGPLWQAARLKLLLDPPTEQPLPSGFLRDLLMRQDEQGEAARRERRMKLGWPKVNAMHDKASQRLGVTVATALEPLAETMVAVPVGSDAFTAWEQEHEERGWPWLPDPGGHPVVYFPAGGPGALIDFEAAVRGTRDDAGGREAAE